MDRESHHGRGVYVVAENQLAGEPNSNVLTETIPGHALHQV